MLYLVTGLSVVAGVLALLLYVKYNQFSLAIAIPAAVTTAVVAVVVNVAFLEVSAFTNFQLPLIVAGVLFVLSLILSGIVTPILSWASFAALIYAPFYYSGVESGVMAIVAVVGGVILTWLFAPVLKTLVISLLSSYNIGFGIALLFLPNAEMTLYGGLIIMVVAFVGTIFLARDRWTKGFRKMANRFKKDASEDSTANEA